MCTLVFMMKWEHKGGYFMPLDVILENLRFRLAVDGDDYMKNILLRTVRSSSVIAVGGRLRQRKKKSQSLYIYLLRGMI